MENSNNTQSGYVLVLVAGVLVILLGFAALAVDVGLMYAAHTAAQRAADAAALAGAYTFVESPFATSPQVIAETRATDTAKTNTILGATIQNAEVAASADVVNRLVTVNLSHTIPTFFAGVLGLKSVTVSVVSYAEAAPPTSPTTADCVKPWFLPNFILSSMGCNACAAHQLIVENNAVTGWVQTNYINTGQEFIMRAGAPSGALAPSDYADIDLTNRKGGAEYRRNISECSPDDIVTCHTFYRMEPGGKVGPTKQGVDDLITINQTVAPDTWNGIIGGRPTYLGPSGNVKYTSHQVVLVAIWDTCNTYCTDPNFKLNGGNMQVEVIGFAMVFIEGMNGKDISARLIGATACAAAPPSGPVTPGIMSLPLRLVRIN